MLDATAHLGEDPILAPGWSEDDVDMLDGLARLSMEVARDIAREIHAHTLAVVEGKTAPRDPAEVVRTGLDFTRVAKTVRMTLVLKAKVLAGEEVEPPPRPAASKAALKTDAAPTPRKSLLYTPDPADPRTYTEAYQQARHHAEIRLAFEHVITDAMHTPQETERLRERLESYIEREAEENEGFYRDETSHLLEKTCKALGLPYSFVALLDETGMFQAWIAGHPDERGPITWPGRGPFYDRFMKPPWRQGPPEDTS